MATDAVEICNLSLSHLGDPGKVTDITTPSSAQETFCSRFYALARDHVLQDKPWKFTTRRAELVIHDGADDDAALEEEWAYAYNQPTGALRILAVNAEGTTGMEHQLSEEFDLYTEADGSVLILTNIGSGTTPSETWCDYIFQTTDTTLFPDNFTLALSYYLASLLAGPLIKGSKGIQLAGAMRQLYEAQKNRVLATDLSQSKRDSFYNKHNAPWIRSR